MLHDPAALLAFARHHQRAGRLAQAAEFYRALLSMRPDHLEGIIRFAHLELNAHDYAAAIPLLTRATQLEPADADHFNNLGVALLNCGRYAEAFTATSEAIRLQPDFALAHSNRGNAHASLNRREEALADYRRCVELDPAYVPAYGNLANMYSVCGRPDEALAATQQAAALNPRDPVIYDCMGFALKELGRLAEACTAYRQALALAPSLDGTHSNLILTLQYRADITPAEITAELSRWAAQHAAPSSQLPTSYPNSREPDRRLRLGYVSSDFYDHVVGRNVLPLFQHHDHASFEIFCYYVRAGRDATTAQFQALADHWRPVAQLTDAALLETIRRDEIDLLIDLNLHTAGNHLAALSHQPAPVQLSFAGYPGTTGLPAFAYRLTDRFLEPPNSASSSGPERALHLPTFWCYTPHGLDLPLTDPDPERPFRFGCLNTFCKLNDTVLALWSQVLRQNEAAEMLILARPGSSRENLRRTFAGQGIAAHRIHFLDQLPRAEYLAAYREIDAVLDTFPYNGHSTALDALWMGVPVIGLVGDRPVARATFSLLTNLGRTETLAQSEADYLRIATDLAARGPRSATARAELRQALQSSILMDGPAFARSLETAYRTAWRRWCESPIPLTENRSGESPASAPSSG